MKKLLFGLLVFCFLLPKAHAEGVSLGITPPTIVIQTAAPAFIERNIRIQNKTDQTITLGISFEPFTQSAGNNGKVSYILDDDSDFGTESEIFQKINIIEEGQVTKAVTLSPKQEKALTLSLTLPEDQPDKDYYFSILFVSKDITTPLATENQKDHIRAYSHLEAAIGLHVLLSILSSEKQPEGFIDAYSAPLFIQSGPVPFTLHFRNTGSYLLTPGGIILIKNMFGQTVGKVTIPKTNVLAKTTRIIPISWTEEFLFGPYSAQLMLTIPDTSISFRRSVSFMAFPIEIIVGITVLIIIFVWLKRRVRRYLPI